MVAPFRLFGLFRIRIIAQLHALSTYGRLELGADAQWLGAHVLSLQVTAQVSSPRIKLCPC